jgi:hypothetical protein
MKEGDKWKTTFKMKYGLKQHSSVLELTKSDLSKINWLRGVILLHPNSVGA